MIKAFISDLHLEAERPEIADLFIQFLKEFTAKENSLYILGDFFEAWIGDDDLTPFNQMIIDALHTATQNGLPIYFMHGNRDFLIGKKFLKMTGCQLLPDEYVVDVFGVPTLLMHGDTLCTEDLKYLKFRKKARSWLFRFVILMQSLKRRRKIAENYRAASKAHTSTSPHYIMDVTQAEVERVMQKHHVQHMIHGHTHRPALHDFEMNGTAATRTVLAAWHDDGRVLLFRDDGKNEIVTLPKK